MHYKSRYLDIQDCDYICNSRRTVLASINSGNNSGWLFKAIEIPFTVISDATFTDGIWYGLNSTNSGNNTGITFINKKPDNLSLMMNSM